MYTHPLFLSFFFYFELHAGRVIHFSLVMGIMMGIDF